MFTKRCTIHLPCNQTVTPWQSCKEQIPEIHRPLDNPPNRDILISRDPTSGNSADNVTWQQATSFQAPLRNNSATHQTSPCSILIIIPLILSLFGFPFYHFPPNEADYSFSDQTTPCVFRLNSPLPLSSVADRFWLITSLELNWKTRDNSDLLRPVKARPESKGQ